MNFRFGPCNACQKAGRSIPAKYRCPACDIVSCSLPCVVLHKTTNNCDGVRNRAARVRKVEYNESNLMSDYTLLEEASRAVGAATRTRTAAIPSYTIGAKLPAITGGISKGRMAMLSREAAKRSINLRFMPRGFARHSRNSSHARSVMEPDPAVVDRGSQKRDKRERVLFWHLDVYFAACGSQTFGSKLVKVEACGEDQNVASILRGAMGALKKGRKRRRTDTGRENGDGDCYSKYITADVKDLTVFLRNEHVLSVPNTTSAPPKKSTAVQNDVDLHRYIRIDTESALKDVLSGKSIVEFPVLHVAFSNSIQVKELLSATSGVFEKPEAEDSSESESQSSSSSSESSSASEAEVETKVKSLAETDGKVKSASWPGTAPGTSTDIPEEKPDTNSDAMVDGNGPITLIPPNLAIPRITPVGTKNSGNDLTEPRIPRKALDGQSEVTLKANSITTPKLAASS